MYIRTYTDGGARGNPGPAGIGGVVYQVDAEGGEHLLAEVSEYIGETTNNQAEYQAIVATLEKALTFKPEKIEMRMDSELAVKQLKGEYRVKNAGLAQLFLKIANLRTRCKSVTFTHVRREFNSVADALVNLAIDKHLSGFVGQAKPAKAAPKQPLIHL